MNVNFFYTIKFLKKVIQLNFKQKSYKFFLKKKLRKKVKKHTHTHDTGVVISVKLFYAKAIVT